MTQAQLACALYPNLDQDTAEARKGDISKLENGRVHNPTTQTIQALARALGISDEEIDALHRRVQMSASEQLDNIPALDRDALELLAGRFDIPGVHSMSEGAIREELTKRAEDWRNLRTEVDAIPDTYRKLTNLKAAAQDAIDRVDPDEVEHLLSQVHYTELDEAARSAELRADNALARGDAERAYHLLLSAAKSFDTVDALEPTRRMLRYQDRFYAHGLRYGGTGLALSEKMIRAGLTDGLETEAPELWARAQNVLARALANQGTRTAGPDGAALLAEAVDSFRAALRVRTEDAHPVDWAKTMQNLAGALQTQGTRTDGPEGATLLAEAVDSYRAALRVCTEDAHPVHWAETTQNLAIALRNQGTRTAGHESAALLTEAVDSYRAALRVRTEDAHPMDWATTMQNLAVALEIQGTGTAGPEGAALLAEAVGSYRAALRVRTEDAHPVDWARAMQNLANALATQGTRTAGPVGAALLTEAVDSHRAALRVRTEDAHPAAWAMTQENLAIAEEARAAHDTATDPRAHLEAALAHVEAALRVYDPEHMPYDYGTATKLRERLIAQLKALD